MYQDVDVQLSAFDIEDEENEDFVFEGEVEEETNKYELCLIDRFLTKKNKREGYETQMTDV